MSKQPRLSQQTLLSILVEEIELLNKSTETIKKTLPLAEQRIQRLEALQQERIRVNTQDLKETLTQEHQNIKKTLSSGMLWPRWAFIVAASITVLFALSVYFVFHYKQQAEEWKSSAEYWHQQANPQQDEDSNNR